MKNFLKIGLMAILFLTATNVSANEDDFLLKVKSEKEKTVRFFVNEGKNVVLSIYGADDEVLFEEKIHSSGNLTKTYDLHSLPEGKYTFVIESDVKLAKYQITIEKDAAIVSKPSIADVFKPALTKENGVVTLNMSNADKNPIQVQVLNEYNEELYTEVFTDKASLSKKFNVDQASTSALTFVVKCNDQKFVQTIGIN